MGDGRTGIEDYLNRGLEEWIKDRKSASALIYKLVAAPQDLTILDVTVMAKLMNKRPVEVFEMINDNLKGFIMNDHIIDAFPDLLDLIEEKNEG